MRTSEQIDKITPAFLAAQKIIDAVVKDQTGKIVTKSGASYEYKYSNLASVLDGVKDALNKNGIAIIQTPTSTADGVTVETTLLHESCQWFAESLFMPIGINSPQGYGAAITYCRRYALQSMVGLKAEDDDAQEKKEKAKEEKQERKDTARQVAVDAFDDLAAEVQDLMRSHAAELGKLHRNRGDVVTYLAEQNFDNEAKLALWSLLPPPVRSWIKDQEKIHRMNGIGRAMQNTQLASQP